MTESRIPAVRQIGSTLWAREVTPLRRFLRTETGSAAFLLGATVAALVWVNISARSYESFWHTTLSVHLGHLGLSQDLHGWVNSGLMTFFFLVVAVEARREFDMGELRERSRLALPMAAGLGGMIVPVLIYLAFTAGKPSAHGWGVAMSTDTAFALGALALVGPNLPDRVRTYLLTFSVVDDVASIVVIAVVYSGQVHVMPLIIGVLLLAFEALLRFRGIRFGALHLLIGVAAWIAVYESGLDPVTVGLVMGLLAYARPAARSDLEQATDLFRLFREQPTAELARSAAEGAQAALSPNDTLEARFHPWTSYVIVPLFALSNADIVITGSFLAKAYTSAVTLGILVGYVVGKPLGTGLGAVLVTKLSQGRVRPPIGWAAVAGTGAIAGVGFTVALLIASLAFSGDVLQEAKLGVLSAVLVASGLSWAVFKVVAKLPKRLKLLALLGTSDSITDLAVAVDPRRDHLRGPAASPVTVVEYGDFECPYCGQAEPVVRKLLGAFGGVLAPARPAAGPSGRADRPGPARVRRPARPGPEPVPFQPAHPHRGGPRGRGRGLGRPVRCVRHADVLHQRHAALRRVRHRLTVGRGPHGPGPRPAGGAPRGQPRRRAGRRRTRTSGRAGAGARAGVIRPGPGWSASPAPPARQL
jgi:Na+/H+ antiporter NhaA